MKLDLAAGGGFLKTGQECVVLGAEPLIAIGEVNNRLTVVVARGQVVGFFPIPDVSFDRTVQIYRGVLLAKTRVNPPLSRLCLFVAALEPPAVWACGKRVSG